MLWHASARGLALLALLVLGAQARSITTSSGATHFSRAAVKGLEAGYAHSPQQQHARTLEQQFPAAASDAAYTEGAITAAALETAPPPADAAAAVAAALGLPMAPAGSTDSYPSTASIPAGQLNTDFPGVSAGQDVSTAQASNSAGAEPAGTTLSGTVPALQQQQQPTQQRTHVRQHRRHKEGETTEPDFSQPSDFGYDVFELPSTASTEQQQQPQQQPQPQPQPQQAQQPQPQPQQHPQAQQTQQLQPDAQQQQPLQQQQTAPPAVSQEDTVNPPNDNSELLPPEAAVPAPAPSPSPSPVPTDDSSSGSTPALPQQPQMPDKGSTTRPWLDPALPISERISSLLRALTLEEKIPMMIHGQAGVPRLGLKPFQFWTECLHGHQERYDGMALPTIFPQPLMLAGTFDPQLAFEVFTAVSDELRAKSNVELGKSGIHKFLTCWTPHINIFKDPRWGRGSETFGEDPYLTSAFAENIVRGLQGQEPSITKVVATCKHFLGYGLEGAEGVSRYSHNIDLAPQDLSDTDLPPFEACVQAAAGKGIMCSYNAVNGEPACASSNLLQGMLRQDLGFDGYVVSDCNAVAALTFGHNMVGSLAEAASASVKAGVDVLCDKPDLVRQAIDAGTLTESDLDAALTNTLRMRFITGQFDPPSANPWASLPVSTVNSKEHRKLARQVVHKGTVLLKNDLVTGTNTPMLPLDKGALSKVCITGPLADSPEHMMGNYYGKWDPEAALTPKKAIKDELAKVGLNVSYSRGMDIVGEIHYDWPLESTLEACAGADVGLVFVGSSMVELKKSSEGDFKPATEGEGLDRLRLELPGRQPDLIKALARRAPGLPLVVVLMHGGGLDVAWMQQVPAVKAILSVPFPGQEGGKALVNLLFGAQSPSGRLPITWYTNSYTAAVSPLNLNMRPSTGHPGRSYRFLRDNNYVLYPFGYGLSYTTFSYSNLRVLSPGSEDCSSPGQAPALCIAVTVTNTGATGFKKPAEHVVPLYLTHTSLAGVDGNPRQSLRGVTRTAPLKPGQSQQVGFTLSHRDFMLARSSDGAPTFEPGVWKVSLGVWDAPLVTDLPQLGPAVIAPGPAPTVVPVGAAPVVAAAPGALVGGQQQQQQQQPPAAGVGLSVAEGPALGLVGAPTAAAAAGAELPAAVTSEPVTYSGGPVALSTAGVSQQEAGQRVTAAQQILQPGQTVPTRVPQDGMAGSGFSSSSSSSSNGDRWMGPGSSSGSSMDALQDQSNVAIDSQRGIAVIVHIPAVLKVT